MIRLDIWLTLEDGSRHLCGEMVCGDPDVRGRIRGEFRYNRAYREISFSFPLDPVSLPLHSQVFECDRPRGIFAVFEDSLPDDWGRKLLVRKAKLPRGRQTLPEMLKALGGSGLGALAYFESDPVPFEDNFISVIDLQALLDAAEQFESGREIEDRDILVLLKAGSSPGGARPKALVQDEDGSHWIAKFPSIQDHLPVVQVEGATMELARKAGLNVPDFRLISCGSKKVLLVKRFDITPEGGRRHMVSFQTLLKAEDWYEASYPHLFEALAKHGSHPEEDLPGLYRHMVFNSLVGNTDDHLKNFWMLHDSSGYFPSPAIDLLPDIHQRREHVLSFGHEGHLNPGVVRLKTLGRRIGISKPQVIVEEVRSGLSDCLGVFLAAGIDLPVAERLKSAVDRNLAHS